jgi:hypothetical protein
MTAGKELDNNMIIRWHRSYLIELISSLFALLEREGSSGDKKLGDLIDT